MKNDMLRLFAAVFLVSGLCCVMEWAGHRQTLLQSEIDVLRHFRGASFSHPLILLPFAGQLLLLAMLWRPKKVLVVAASLLLGLLPLMIFLAGAISRNMLMAVSAVPYLAALLVFLIRLAVTARNNRQRGR
jgi:hypothetical protein